MDIPTASSFDELQRIFDTLKQSNEPNIHGNLLFIYIIFFTYFIQ